MSKKEKLLFYAIVTLCFGIRIALITQKNLWFDEIYSWHITFGSFSDIIRDTSSDIHPPFYYFVLKIWIGIFNDSVFSMRFLSALIMTSAIFFIYPLTKKILNVQLSLIVLLLYSLSPLNIFYAQEVRMSALNLFLNLAAVYSFVQITNNNNIYKNKHSYIFILFTILALYTHYFSFLILFAELTYLVYLHFSKHYKSYRLLPLIIVPLLSYIPWYPIMLNQAARGQQWRNPNGILEVIKELVNYIRDVSLGLYYSDMNGMLLKLITLILISLILLGMIVTIKNLLKKNLIKENVFIILLVIIPLLFAIILSFRQRIEFFRYLSILVPYILIAFVVLMSMYKQKYFLSAMMIIFISINLYGLGLQYSKDYKNNNYREVIKKINSNFESNDKIYVEPHYYGWIIDYYQKQGGLKIPKTENYGFSFNMMLDSIHINRPENFWLALDYSSMDTLNYLENVSKIKSNYNLVSLNRFKVIPNDIELYKFKLK